MNDQRIHDLELELSKVQSRLRLCELSRKGAMEQRERLLEVVFGLLCTLEVHESQDRSERTLAVKEDALAMNIVAYDDAVDAFNMCRGGTRFEAR